MFSIALAEGLALLASFSTAAHAGPVLPAVGPRPAGEYQEVSCGYLKVFSRTEQTEWGENTYYYPHTAYTILDASGHKVREVDNRDSEIDERPSRVELRPGTYFVKAWSDNDGLVTVPVIIKLARTTSVHLEEGRASDQDVFDASRAVKTPSGQVVGWKA
jgi:hypothetical protein